MTPTPRIHDEAVRELEAAAQYYDSSQVGARDRFLAAVETAFDRLQGNPLLGASVAEGYRRYRVLRFPYLVFYEVVGGDVRVLAVAHQAREPMYWLGRT